MDGNLAAFYAFGGISQYDEEVEDEEIAEPMCEGRCGYSEENCCCDLVDDPRREEAFNEWLFQIEEGDLDVG